MNWIPLTSLNTLNEIEAESYLEIILLFKHSTRCSISRNALKYFEHDFKADNSLAFKCYYLDLLNYRNISDQIATKFNVRHESPQLLLIRDGKCVLNQTHEQINAVGLKNYI